MTATLTYPTAPNTYVSSDTPITVQDRRRHGFFIIDNIIIDEYACKIGASAYFVYSGLARMTNREGICFPSLNRLSKLLGLSRPTLTKAIDTLIEHGLIAKQHRFNDKGEHISNLYILLDVIRGNEGSKKTLPPPSKKILPPSQRGSKKTLPKQDTPINNTQQTEQDTQTQVQPLAISEMKKSVVVALMGLGVSENVSDYLADRYSTERITEKIAYLEFVQKEQPSTIKNPCGWLRAAIIDDFAKPDGFVSQDERARQSSHIWDISCDQVESEDGEMSFWEKKKADQKRCRQELTEKYGTTEEDFTFWEKAKLEIAYTTQPHIGELVAQTEILQIEGDRVIIGVPEQEDYRQLQHPGIQKAINQALSYVAGRSVTMSIEDVSEDVRRSP